MRRIYWDSMLFIYWLERHPDYRVRIRQLFNDFQSRGDEICTSILTVGEVLVGPIQKDRAELKLKMELFFDSGVITILPIKREVMNIFAQIRARTKIAPADALHLACAATHGTDLFLTNDKTLHRHQIPGIQFIAGLDVNLF